MAAKESEQAGLVTQLSSRNSLLDALVAELQSLRQEVRFLAGQDHGQATTETHQDLITRQTRRKISHTISHISYKRDTSMTVLSC